MSSKVIGRTTLLTAVVLSLLIVLVGVDNDAAPVLLALLWAMAIPIWMARVALSREPPPLVLLPPRNPRPPRCQGCGYDLRATPYRCPECGRESDHFTPHLIDPMLLGEDGPLAPDARDALSGAIWESGGLGHDYVGSEHLLLSLLRQPESRGGRCLGEAGLSYATVREQVLELVGRGEWATPWVASVPAATPVVDRLLRRLAEPGNSGRRRSDSGDMLAFLLEDEGASVVRHILSDPAPIRARVDATGAADVMP